MSPRGPRTRLAAAAGIVSLAALAACAPGSSGGSASTPTPGQSVSTDVGSLGAVTLTIWDQEVRGGQAAQMEKLNKEFQAKYPNVTIKRVSRSFDDLKTTLRLALSGNEPPDVVQANNGRSDMGEFVKAGELVPLDAYADAYKWKDRFSPAVLQYSSYSPDGKTFGEGSIYGLPQVGEVVGIYVNTAKLKKLGVEMPTTWADFTDDLAKAKAAGELPMQFGNIDKWPAIHVFGTVQDRTTPADQITTLAFGRPGASWTTPENMTAAQTLADWVDKGYFPDGFNGQGYDPAWQAFGKGTGVFLIAGTWLQADLQKAMGSDVAFIAPPPESADAKPISTGGTGLPFAITSKSKSPAAAAAYLDFITSTDAAKVLTSTDNLPIVDTGQQDPPAGLATDIFDAFGTVVDKQALVPYLDYATPTMYDTLGAALQDLLAKKQTPEQFLDTLQKDYSGFAAKSS